MIILSQNHMMFTDTENKLLIYVDSTAGYHVYLSAVGSEGSEVLGSFNSVEAAQAVFSQILIKYAGTSAVFTVPTDESARKRLADIVLIR